MIDGASDTRREPAETRTVEVESNPYSASSSITKTQLAVNTTLAR
jgi:hypothetical protein